MNTGEELTIEQEFIVLGVPASTVELTINAKIWRDGEVAEVSRKMPFEEVRDAIKEAQEGYIPSDAIFTLTDLGREELERLKGKYSDDEEE